AVTFGDGGWTLYVDGVAVNTNAYTGGLGANDEPIVLGANQWGSAPGTADDLDHPFTGTITSAAIYDAPLSAALVGQLAGIA
ncbi:MAG: hypothetical protein P5693_26580, partial [Limnospira sp. PMC 1290.21]|uniref:LamG-like jellyroll fold domain-containing protein n=1 Tax=Limnospira sp. PMC 1290.21 TaxID=2981073 RepID=UPI0028E17266